MSKLKHVQENYDQNVESPDDCKTNFANSLKDKDGKMSLSLYIFPL